jgi:hypothetical protein
MLPSEGNAVEHASKLRSFVIPVVSNLQFATVDLSFPSSLGLLVDNSVYPCPPSRLPGNFSSSLCWAGTAMCKGAPLGTETAFCALSHSETDILRYQTLSTVSEHTPYSNSETALFSQCYGCITGCSPVMCVTSVGEATDGKDSLTTS